MPTQPYERYRSGRYHYEIKSGFKLINEPRKPLPYGGIGSYVKPTSSNATFGEANLPFRSWCTSVIDGPSREANLAHNKALARFQDQLGPQSQLGSTLAMWRESAQMVALRATQMRKAYQHLKRGRFQSFLKELGAVPKRKHTDLRRSKPKEAGGLWLEYWMGWAPLVGDIHSSLQVATTTLPAVTVKATASTPVSYRQYVDNMPYGLLSRTAEGKVVVKIQANVWISNPNLYLADRLGLLNPVYILYDMMPWSWMLNWFVNIEQLAISVVPPQGITYDRAFTTRHCKCKGSYEDLQFNWGTSSYDVLAGSWEGYTTRRSLGVPSSYKVVWNFSGLSYTRAATAISLLLQQLKA